MYNHSSNAFEAYQNNQINTASKGKLLLMLYDGGIKFLKFALIALEDKNIEKTNEYIIRTQDILTELRVTLNFDAGDIAKNLDHLYEYMNYQLIQGNIKKDPKLIEEVLDMFKDLRDTWGQIIK